MFLYDLVDHDISSEFPPYIDEVCGSCEKKEKYKFWEIFSLRRSHIWHLFLRARPRNPQLQSRLCLQRRKLPLHRMHVQVSKPIGYNCKIYIFENKKETDFRESYAKRPKINMFLQRATVFNCLGLQSGHKSQLFPQKCTGAKQRQRCKSKGTKQRQRCTRMKDGFHLLHLPFTHS